MRLLIAFAGCLALATSIAAASGNAHETKGPAGLRLLDRDPVTLKGLGFYRGERVRLTSVAGLKRRTRTLRVNGAGAFVATFADQAIDRCMGFRATAEGSRGSEASLKLPELLCPPKL